MVKYENLRWKVWNGGICKDDVGRPWIQAYKVGLQGTKFDSKQVEAHLFLNLKHQIEGEDGMVGFWDGNQGHRFDGAKRHRSIQYLTE